MKKSIVAILMAGCLLTGCGATASEEADKAESSQSTEQVTEQDTTTTESADSEDENIDVTVEDAALDISFSDLAAYRFDYSSGAGGWGDELHIAKDGYFYGLYHDSEMGESGDAYPDGTVYSCNYSGQFTNLTKVADNVYEMTVTGMTYANTPNTEEISDNVRYVYSTAAGLPESGTVKLYMPGANLSAIDSDIYDGYLAMYEEGNKSLSAPVIVCQSQGSGFYGTESDYKESAELDYTSYKYSYDYYAEEAANATDSATKLDCANSNARLMNQLLNELWTIYKHNSDSATFEKALAAQRTWLSDKETQMQAAQAACADATEGQAASASKEAELTIARCKELVEMIKAL